MWRISLEHRSQEQDVLVSTRNWEEEDGVPVSREIRGGCRCRGRFLWTIYIQYSVLRSTPSPSTSLSHRKDGTRYAQHRYSACDSVRSVRM
jgi:hypothetical protein